MMKHFVFGVLLISIVGCAGPPYIDHLAGVPFAPPPVNPPPFFHQREVFLEGNYLYAAVDPNRYPSKVGDTYSIYVVEHKTHTQWDADPSLVDVTSAVETRTLIAGTLNHNYGVVWADMSLPSMSHKWHKAYDIVFDFGNDGNYDKEDDILDRIGVLERFGAEETGGFTLLKDPASAGDFPVSTHPYNAGEFPVATKTIELSGQLYYPASSAGIDQPVNTDLANYPLIIIAHGHTVEGNPTSYLGFEYLCQHLASRGFICASIALHELSGDVGNGHARAVTILKHVTALLLEPEPATAWS